MKEYFEQIILPYINKKREDLKLIVHHPALLIFDNTSVHQGFAYISG